MSEGPTYAPMYVELSRNSFLHLHCIENYVFPLPVQCSILREAQLDADRDKGVRILNRTAQNCIDHMTSSKMNGS